MQVEEFLQQSADRFPDKTALVCGRRRVTYRDMERSSNKLAHALIANGMQRWERVVIFAGNTIETAIAIFGTLKAGGVFVLINPTVKADKLAFVLNNCRASAMITTTKLVPVARVAVAESPYLQNVLVAGEHDLFPDSSEGQRWMPLEAVLANQPDHRCPNKNIDIDLAALIYTSGSTGRPKGVMVTHLNVVSAANSITTYLANSSDDVILNVLPLSFDYGLYQLLMAFKVGGTLVLEQSFTYPHATLKTLADEKVTGFPIVPTICSILLQMDLSHYSFPHLRYITNTAAALPVEHIRKLRHAFPQVSIFSMYGLTECKRVSYLPPNQLDLRPRSVGRGMPNEEVYVVDEDGHRLKPGSIGELVVRGSNVMKGYWELPQETDAVLRPGLLPGEKVLYTGDLFRTDEEGYLYFVGRKDDIIKTRGEKVSPREVEELLYSHPQVAEAAVVGIPDEILGNAVCAFVTCKEGAGVQVQELFRFCADHLEDFMIPKHIHLGVQLPKSANGKIDKKMLVAEAVDLATKESVLL